MSERQFEDLVKGRDLHGQDFSGQDLSGAYLREANLEGAILRGTNLEGAILVRANLTHADLSYANLAHADLTRADLTRADLVSADLNHARATDATFRYMPMDKARAVEAFFNGSTWHNVHADGLQAPGAEFAEAHLSYVGLANSVLCGASFFRAKANDVRFVDVNLGTADFNQAHLDTCDFTGANLGGAELKRAQFENCILVNADLSETNLAEMVFMGTNNLSGVQGLPLASDRLAVLFESDDLGLIVYKAFGRFYHIPPRWTLEPGVILTETVDPSRSVDCSSGIHVTTLPKVWELVEFHNMVCPIWRCRIRWTWLADVVVPYPSSHNDREVWKVRTAKLELIEPMTMEQVCEKLGLPVRKNM